MFLDCPFEAGGHQIRVNTMKLFKTMATIALVASSIGFASCSDDKNEPADGNDRNDGQEMVVNPSNVFTTGVPKQVGSMSITTGANGLVTAMSDPEDGVKITFTYPTMSRADSYDVIMTKEEDGDKDIFNMLLNEAGFATYCKQIESDGNVEEWWFDYNADGQLIMMKRSEGGNEVTEITYSNGNITAVKMRSEDDGDGGDHIISYGSSLIENKGCIMLFDETFGIDMDEMAYAYFAGLLGKATKNLPASNSYTSFEPQGEPYSYNKTFTWSLNAANLPTLLTTITTDEWGSSEETFEFAW